MNRLPKNSLYHLALTLLLTGMLTILPLCAWGMVSATWDISTSGGVKTYTYTFTNNIDPKYTITQFGAHWPEASFSLVSDMSITSIFDGVEHPVTAEYYYYDFDYLYIERWVTAGESLRMRYTTSDEIPTEFVEGWFCNQMVNDRGERVSLNVLLPTPAPVPEPSSILALLCGMGGLAGAVMKRRR